MGDTEISFHNIGPLPLLDLGFIQIPTYYLVISIAYCLSIFWFYKRCESRNLPQKNAMDISLILLVAGFIGARLTHIIFEQPTYYIDNPLQIFSFWQGGFVFYGGALFGYLCAYLYAKKLQVTFWLWHDTLAPVLALGYAIGRLACYLTGCCYGRLCNLPWATQSLWVNLNTGVAEEVFRHPTQLYASFWEFTVVAILLWYEKRKPSLGFVFLYWVILHGTGRFIMEVFRDDPRGPSLMGLSISSLVSIELVFAASIVLINKKKA